MKRCAQCGKEADLPFQCNYCDSYFCSKHRLPEKHRCSELRVSSSTSNSTKTSSIIAGHSGASTRLGALLHRLKSIIIAPFNLLLGILVLLFVGIVSILKRATILFPVIVIIVFIVGATIGTGIAPVDNTATNISSAIGETGNSIGDTLANATNDTTTDSEPADQEQPTAVNQQSTGSESTLTSDRQKTTQESLSRSEIEMKVHGFVNDYRRDHNLPTLQFDSELQRIARYHSEDMVQNGYFAHQSPGGETMADRYERFGYQCRVEVSINRYATGAENLASTYADSNILTNDGTVNYQNKETAIAQGVVRQWIDSSGHRDNLLKPYWNAEGIGVAITETDGDTRIYVTQNFC